MNERRLLAACLAISLSCSACGGLESVAPEPTTVFWHAEARRIERHRLPAGAHAAIASLALPEVHWTGVEAEPVPGERVAVGIFADGSVSFGPTRLEPDALTAAEGVTALVAQEALLGTFPVGLSEDPPPRVEIYVDRSASWERVRSVLLFLAMPPRGPHDLRLAAVRSDDAKTAVLLPVRVERRSFWSNDTLRDLPDWSSRLERLPVLAGDLQRGDYDWGFSFGRVLTRVTDPERGVDGIDLAGVEVPTPGRLENEHVVLRANWGWAAWAGRSVWDSRRFRGMELRVSCVERESSWTPVPAAYALQAVDLAHVDGLAARILALDGVYLLFEPPPSLAPPAESGALPSTVVLLCVLGVVLAFVSTFVLSGSRRSAAS